MSEIAAATNRRVSRFLWIGLVLLCVGIGPLLVVILAAQLGLTPVHARCNQRWLILFSLDVEAARESHTSLSRFAGLAGGYRQRWSSCVPARRSGQAQIG